MLNQHTRNRLSYDLFYAEHGLRNAPDCSYAYMGVSHF